MKREAYKEMAAINQLSKQIKSANKRANSLSYGLILI